MCVWYELCQHNVSWVTKTDRRDSICICLLLEMVTYPSENEVLICSKWTDPKGNLELLDWIFVIWKEGKNVMKWEYKIIKWKVGSSCL